MTAEEKDVLAQLLCKLPTFEQHWNKYVEQEIQLAEELGEALELNLYDVAFSFSPYVIEQYEAGNFTLLKEAFKFIEEMGSHPNESISNCAMVGFVEGILFARNHEGIALEAFDNYLGKESKAFWYEMHGFFVNNNKLHRKRLWLRALLCFPLSIVSGWVIFYSLGALVRAFQNMTLGHGAEILLLLPFAIGCVVFEIGLVYKLLKSVR